MELLNEAKHLNKNTCRISVLLELSLVDSLLVGNDDNIYSLSKIRHIKLDDICKGSAEFMAQTCEY